MSYGLLLLRLFVGFAFFGHGTQKLFGWFGGHGPQGTGGFFTSIGFRSRARMAVLAGVAAAACRTPLAFRLPPPRPCRMIAVVMLVAILRLTFRSAFIAGSQLA